MKEVRSLFIVPPSKQTLYYWRKRGVRVNGKSVWLGWFKNGGRYMSTKEAVARFKQAYNGEYSRGVSFTAEACRGDSDVSSFDSTDNCCPTMIV